ncbi:hypothetical protein ACIRU3_06830 [Streptomyces sp. NPDC101151]|uniref:hypothetical protein n=1 Tax=Streptomyces sp. NPDC101151 TaxID=3366115 RepID=UPI0038243FCE
MPTTADQLLSALEPLPFPTRLTHTATTARRLADEGRLTSLLTGLDARGPYERRLAALDDAGVTVATQIASRLRTDRVQGALPRRGGALLAAADQLARDRRRCHRSAGGRAGHRNGRRPRLAGGVACAAAPAARTFAPGRTAQGVRDHDDVRMTSGGGGLAGTLCL